LQNADADTDPDAGAHSTVAASPLFLGAISRSDIAPMARQHILGGGR
jgi:hypothetical protein